MRNDFLDEILEPPENLKRRIEFPIARKFSQGLEHGNGKPLSSLAVRGGNADRLEGMAGAGQPGTFPSRIVASTELSRLPPETTAQTLASAYRPDSAAATDTAPAPSATT
jgi:hypothetical protein